MIKTTTKIILDYFGVTLEDVRYKGPGSRRRVFVEPRFMIAYMLKKHNKEMSLQQVGNVINRGHADVLHAIRQVENLVETDKETRKKFNDISKMLDAITPNQLNWRQLKDFCNQLTEEQLSSKVRTREIPKLLKQYES